MSNGSKTPDHVSSWTHRVRAGYRSRAWRTISARSCFRRWPVGGVLLVILVVAWSARGDTELERMAKELAGLRSDLDRIDGELRAERNRSSAELRALEGRRAALDQQLDTEQVRQTTAVDKARALTTKLSARGDRSAELQPVLEQSLAALREVIEAGLPFRRQERLAALEDLETQLRTKQLAPETIAIRLWQLIEDELQLAAEVVRTKVPLEIGGESGHRRLVDAVRIGMVALYVRGDGEGFAQLVRDGASWQLEPITDARLQAEVAALFDNVGKQVLEADYVLPLPPVTGPES